MIDKNIGKIISFEIFSLIYKKSIFFIDLFPPKFNIINSD